MKESGPCARRAAVPDVNGHKAQRDSLAVLFQGEVPAGRILESRVRHDGCDIFPEFLLHLLQGVFLIAHTPDHRLLSGNVIKKIVVGGEHVNEAGSSRAVARHIGGLAVGYNNIPLQKISRMHFPSGKLHRRFFGKGKDIIPHRVHLPIVLIKAVAAGVIAHIVLQENKAAALIGIQGPPAIMAALHMVDQIPPHHRAGLSAKQIDPPHIRQLSLPDMVDVILFDEIVAGNAFPVSPYPSAGNAGIIKLADGIVGDHIVVAVHQENAAGGKIP